MGDFLSPKRDFYDRFRRRIENFRNRHIRSQERFEPSIIRHYQQEQQDTLLLRQKWLENRGAKKPSKQNKTTKDTNSQADHRNLIVTQKLKRKIDGSNPLEVPPVDNSAPYAFNDADSPPAKKPTTDTSNSSVEKPSLSSVSVHIVQQISGGTPQEQKIEANFTLKTHFGRSDDASTPSVNEAPTRVEYKREPTDESEQSNAAADSTASDIEFDKEFHSIINGEIPADIIDQLNEFQEIFDKVQQSETTDSSVNSGMFAGPVPSASPGLAKANVFSDSSSPGSINQMYDATTNMGSVRTPPLTSFRAQGQGAVVPSLSESGPAAETLKQMAAHHQNQQGPPGPEYGIKTVIPTYSEQLPQENATFPNRNGYPVEYSQQQNQTAQQSAQPYNAQIQSSVYLNSQQGPVGDMRTPIQYPQSKRERDLALTYGQTKPLTHYSQPQPHAGSKPGAQPQQPTQSSLQQLQNFTQGQMQVTQTQHMQVTDGTNRLQMSQTQQMQMRQPVQQLNVSQQQSFSMSPNMAGTGPTPTPPTQFPNQAPAQQAQGQYMSEQMNMQMFEKMRQEQRQQKLLEQQNAQMQQYMNRPPPEYKMQPGNGMTNSYSSNSTGSNPLQPMQNMVNQTSSLAGSQYGPIKSENPHMQMTNGMMQPVQMSAMQHLPNSANASMPGMQPSRASQSPVTTYPGPQVQRQSSYPGAQSSVPVVRAPRPNAPSYTSTIMRNQRPPNVNVGPDGLNISQPRAPMEWPRQVMHAQGPRVAPASGTPAMMNRPEMAAAASVMQYGSYANQGNMNSNGMQARPMQINMMQSQQAAAMQGSVQAQVMMRQNMQISQQRMNSRTALPNGQTGTYNMSSAPMSATVDTNSSNFPPSGSQTQDEFYFLDSSARNNTDLFDGISQNPGVGSDANWLDEILRK